MNYTGKINLILINGLIIIIGGAAIGCLIYYINDFVKKVNEIKDISNSNIKIIEKYIRCQKRKICKIQNKDYELCQNSPIKDFDKCINVKNCTLIGNADGCPV